MDKLILKNLSATNLADLSNILPSELRDVFSEIFSRVALKGELRQVRMLTSEIPTYFIMTGATEGLGKSGLDYEGWAICNGKNTTEDDGGLTYVGYKKSITKYSQLSGLLGEETHTLTVSELPPHTHGYDNFPGGSASGNADSHPDGQSGTKQTGSTGNGTPFNIMQPSKVVLKLQRL